MNIPSLLLNRLRLIALAVTLGPMLTACPLMMPFMMGPMHGGGLHGGGEQGEEKIAQELVEEGVVALAANHGPYQTLVVGQVSVQDVFMSATQFRGLVVRTLRSRREWQLGENESYARPERGSEALPPEGAFGLLNGQFYREGDRLWLAVQLVDDRSGGLFWSGLFSRPSVSQAGHAGH